MPISNVVYDVWTTPIGPLGLAACAGRVLRIEIDAEDRAFAASLETECGTAPARDVSAIDSHRRAVDEYLAGHTRTLALPLDLRVGTPFQRAVWALLASIPVGEVRTYAWLARHVGNERAVRAVGQANG